MEEGERVLCSACLLQSPSCPLPTPAPGVYRASLPAQLRQGSLASMCRLEGLSRPSVLLTAQCFPASSPQCRETWWLWGNARIWGGSAGQRDRCSWCTRHRSWERQAPAMGSHKQPWLGNCVGAQTQTGPASVSAGPPVASAPLKGWLVPRRLEPSLTDPQASGLPSPLAILFPVT